MWNIVEQSSSWKEFNKSKDERGPITAEVKDPKAVLMTSSWRRVTGFIAGKQMCCEGLNSWTLLLLEQYTMSFSGYGQPCQSSLPIPISFLLPKRAWVLCLSVIRGCWPSQWGLAHLHPPCPPHHQRLAQEEEAQGVRGKAEYVHGQTFASGCHHFHEWYNARQV